MASGNIYESKLRSFYRSKEYLQKVSSGHGLKSMLPVTKIQQNAIEDYVKPVVKMRYRNRTVARR